MIKFSDFDFLAALFSVSSSIFETVDSPKHLSTLAVRVPLIFTHPLVKQFPFSTVRSADSPVREEVIKEMIPYLGEQYGNASAMYSLGRNARKAINKARGQVATAINCNPHEIYFTSCGSESDNLAIKGIAYANKEKGTHIITTKIEHHAVSESCEFLEKQGFRVTYLNVDEKGFVNLKELEESICNDTILISIMFANNEIRHNRTNKANWRDSKKT